MIAILLFIIVIILMFAFFSGFMNALIFWVFTLVLVIALMIFTDLDVMLILSIGLGTVILGVFGLWIYGVIDDRKKKPLWTEYQTVNNPERKAEIEKRLGLDISAEKIDKIHKKCPQCGNKVMKTASMCMSCQTKF